ncbi:metal-sensitive transcriptional regulator [Alpinimonas psychrophila]|uniref:DNA-binding FrmR family transcriptional regulator n=1 Tax=Alpinimonas psychrophila TaxID=748908 RepID=A0A7W3JSZ8_9MICO|nr:metal-sensitive transcriptional regulator [Alpinimonas psychrophila]MBA8828655.1 DNA-binding FrmR family transcriptional regulator [Alpinimonas psychrophila]
MSEISKAEQEKKILNRLKRAQGQLTAVISAVEKRNDCRSVVTQLSAVTSALDKAGFAIIAHAMQECLADTSDDVDGSKPTVSELEKLFMSLA